MNAHHTHNLIFFFFNDTATTEIYTLSLHDALPIWAAAALAHHWPKHGWQVHISSPVRADRPDGADGLFRSRSEEHTSELQSRSDLVCRLLLEKKKITRYSYNPAH